MNIVISGLTAAGKTTIANTIAPLLGCDYLSASSVMYQLLGTGSNGSNAAWVESLEDIGAARADNRIDEAVNAILAQEMATRENTVFDSWSMPWLPSSHAFRIWIDSDPGSRARKVRISQEPNGPFLTLEQCANLATAKDQQTAERFAEILGCDLFNDRSPFDLVWDATEFTVGNDVRTARPGISTAVRAFCSRLLECERFLAHHSPRSIAQLQRWLNNQEGR